MVKRVLSFNNKAAEGKPPACEDFERAWTYICLAKDSRTYEQYEEIAEIKREFKKHGSVKRGFNDAEIPHIIEFAACCDGGCKITLTDGQLRRAIAAVKSVCTDPELLRNANAEEIIGVVKFLESAEKIEE